MALSHIYCNKFSLETFEVISVWLLLCYKSFEYCVCVSITDTGMTLKHRDLTVWGRVATRWYQSTRWVLDMTTKINHRSLFSTHFWLLSIFYSLGWRTRGTSLHNRMKIHLLYDTWRKPLDTWTLEYQAWPGPTTPLYQKRSIGWFEFMFQEGHSRQSLSP